MAKPVIPLNASQIDGLRPKEREYAVFDGAGLLLLIRTSGTKTWQYRYKNYNGDIKKITLGEYPALSLKVARDKRRSFEEMVANSIDPKEQLELLESKKANVHILESITRLWWSSMLAKGAWSEYTAYKRLKMLENHLFPLIGTMPIEDIRPKHLASSLTQIEKTSSENAQRIKAMLINIFNYAIQHGLIETNHALTMNGLLVPKKSKHRPSLPLDQLPKLLQGLEQDTGRILTRLCTSLSLHIFSRSSEIRFARWDEIDFDKRIWTIPPYRQAVNGTRFSDRGSKMREEHFVPLSKQAIQILRQIQEYSGHCNHVFPAITNDQKFISENIINETLQRMGYDTQTEICGHGFRTMACAALIQSTLFSEDAVERQMSHRERNEVRAAYTHTAEFMEERKVMMQWWSDYLDINAKNYISPYDYGQECKSLATLNNVINSKRA
ncbi:TPA: integrase arm-type DNA-binding domain-containing protein [Acinetobacter baumannii]|nr:integrase arm-type DNA-binding domain-containing protein [Acinetobacter baumannii]